VQMIHPEVLTPALMRRKVEELVRSDPASMPHTKVNLSGAARAVELVYAGVAEKHALVQGA
jgi:hypothetical protein